MRIVCQQCQAAYTIADATVAARGVRAQCPRCRHLQLVKPGDTPIPSSSGVFGLGIELNPGKKEPTALPDAPDPFASPFDFGADRPSSESNPFDFGSLPASTPGTAPLPPVAPAPRLSAPKHPAAPAPRLSAPKPPAVSRPATPVPMAPVPAQPAPPASRPTPAPVRSKESPNACRSCGKTMTDPFDLALGICDSCRQKAEGGAAPAPSAPVPSPVQSASSHKVAPQVASPFHEEFSSTVEPSRPASARKRWVALAAVGAVVLGTAAIVLVVRPWKTAPPPLAVAVAEPNVPVDATIAQWRLKYPELERTSVAALIEEGESLLAKDTTQAYADAEEAFEQVLVLEPSNHRALTGWVLSLAFGHVGQLDESVAKTAESLLSQEEQRSGAPGLFVAHAHLLIARGGNANDIKVLAERGQASDDANIKALAALAVGQAVLAKNSGQAAQSFAEALQLDPNLKRAYLSQAQLAASQGQYAAAMAALEHRLELDANQWEASESLARLLIELGDVSRAKAILEAAHKASPKDARPHLGLGMLAYQHQGDFKTAVELFSQVTETAGVPKGDKCEAYVHLAAIARISGDLPRAANAIARALELRPDSVAARLQHFLTLLDKGVASSARLELDGLKGQLSDRQLEATLEGRLLLAEGRLADAAQTLRAAGEADPRRVDAILLAGAASAKAREDGQSWDACLRRGLKVDPYTRLVPPLTDLYVRPADLLKPAVGAYASLVGNLNEDPNPSLCEGLVAWFSDDVGAADKHFARATQVDPKNAQSHAYRTFVALRRKDLNGAKREAALALDSSKTNALVYFAQAQVQVQTGKLDLAKEAAQRSLRYGPSLLGPKTILGAAEAAQQNPEEARKLLTSVLLADPLYGDAKRILYKHRL